MITVTLEIEPWPQKNNQFKGFRMVIISENMKFIGEKV